MWYEPPCPFCSKAKGHFGYTAGYTAGGRYKCFHCGESGSLYGLAKELQLLPDSTYVPKSLPRPSLAEPEKPAAPPAWLAYGEHLVEGYTSHPMRVQLWQAYKPIQIEMIQRYGLGVGVIPGWERRGSCLTVPVWDETGRIIGLRGRAQNGDGPKWINAPGTGAYLYNLPEIGERKVLWIVENMIDALLIMQSSPDYDAAAPTTGVSTWREEWSTRIAAMGFEMVIVAYDNDLPGQASGKMREGLLREWAQTHPGQQPPKPNGPKVANDLLRAGAKAVLYEWQDAPAKADIGWLLSQHPEAA